MVIFIRTLSIFCEDKRFRVILLISSYCDFIVLKNKNVESQKYREAQISQRKNIATQTCRKYNNIKKIKIQQRKNVIVQKFRNAKRSFTKISRVLKNRKVKMQKKKFRETEMHSEHALRQKTYGAIQYFQVRI